MCTMKLVERALQSKHADCDFLYCKCLVFLAGNTLWKGGSKILGSAGMLISLITFKLKMLSVLIQMFVSSKCKDLVLVSYNSVWGNISIVISFLGPTFSLACMNRSLSHFRQIVSHTVYSYAATACTSNSTCTSEQWMAITHLCIIVLYLAKPTFWSFQSTLEDFTIYDK